MVKLIKTVTYACEKCGTDYPTRAVAEICESKPMDPINARVGDYVGVSLHWWWGADTSWTMSQPTPKMGRPKGMWEKSPPGPFSPQSGRCFLPIFRVVGFAQHYRHSHRVIIWSPRHANRMPLDGRDYGEALNFTTTSGHHNFLPINYGAWPSLTDTERARFDELCKRTGWHEIRLI